MYFTIRPSSPSFGAELLGCDLRGASGPGLAAAVCDAMDRYGVCVFRDQSIVDEQQIEFSRLFGALEKSPNFGRGDSETVRMKFPELFDVSNLDERGGILPDSDRRRMFRLANMMWHTDSSFQPGGAGYSLLSARVVPSSGADTEFADMRAAYDALSQPMKERVEGLVAEHSTFHSRSLIGYQFTEEELRRRRPTLQYVVQTHPRSGRRSLYLGSHASHIVGLPVEEGRALLTELAEFATSERFVHRHQWRAGDLLIWDNRCTMHRATPFDDFSERRDLRRTTVVGDLPVVQQEALPA
jgi:alpha-ketoglutarate-dependent 2,4-dichlorophenoxyacetate dioxygenase